jgi:predicted nucleic acid-binding protein
VRIYVDTAILLKAFVREADSAAAITLLEKVGEPFAYSHLHDLEIPNAVRLKRFCGEITKAQEAAAIRVFRAEVAAGCFGPLEYDLAAVFARAEELSAKYSGEQGARSLDSWHVAAALEGGCTGFASYDGRQRKAAAASGLEVLPKVAPGVRR